jgi:hypothetical protein
MSPLRFSRTTGKAQARQRFMLRQRMVAVAVLLGILLAPCQSNSVPSSNNDDDCVAMELSALGKDGDTIARARQQVLDILQQRNGCAAWYRESDQDPAEIFRSLHFEVEWTGPSRIYGMRNSAGQLFFKHPWGAKSMEYSGRNSIIRLNANGPFFNRTSPVVRLESGGTLEWPSGNRMLTISTYNGATPEAQIIILLHELGHIIGRLPEDDGSWDGRSVRNTAEVVRYCKAETIAAARNSLHASN